MKIDRRSLLGSSAAVIGAGMVTTAQAQTSSPPAAGGSAPTAGHANIGALYHRRAF